MKDISKKAFKIRVSVIILSLIATMGISQCVKAEPFPESLKKHPQVMECYTWEMRNGTQVVGNDKWIITWDMAEEWYPNAKEPYIIFNARIRTRIPFEHWYSCTAWIPSSKQKEEKK